ncbi:MAG: hypothetical protein OEM63_09535 [Gammaproteobacteria bacterium]|nr:hypothetical protein [Gammaproteobacteria bacterium]
MMPLKTLSALYVLCLAGPAWGDAPLFASDEALGISIEAPLRNLIRNKSRKNEYDAVVRYVNDQGEQVTLDAKISARGNARLGSCDFPPIRLEFDPEKTAGTVFDGQRRLKMVTHCQRGSDGTRWVLQEYGIYRAYNVITDFSYRVRKLDVTYQDSKSARWNRNAPAFFIEATGQAADRLGMDSIRPPEVKTEQYELVETTNLMLFQYLIANTDFSVKRGPEGEGCCHNARIIAPKGAQAGWVVLPYDFDQAGIINTDYSATDRRLGIRVVTTRLYRGFCWQNEPLKDAISMFTDKREAITAALIPDEIPASRHARIRRYVDRFYDTINDPAELQENLLAKCRGGATFAIRKTTTAGQ